MEEIYSEDLAVVLNQFYEQKIHLCNVKRDEKIEQITLFELIPGQSLVLSEAWHTPKQPAIYTLKVAFHDQSPIPGLETVHQKTVRLLATNLSEAITIAPIAYFKVLEELQSQVARARLMFPGGARM